MPDALIRALSAAPPAVAAAVGRSLGRKRGAGGPSVAPDEFAALIDALTDPPRPRRREPPRPRVGAPVAATRRCPSCAEEVLAAARLCKRCRYGFDEPDARASSS